jgi:hypothetical protein
MVRDWNVPVDIGCPNMTHDYDKFISDLPRYLFTRIGRFRVNHKKGFIS